MVTEAKWDNIRRSINVAAGLHWRNNKKVKIFHRSIPEQKAINPKQVDCSGLSISNAFIKTAVDASLIKVDLSKIQVIGCKGRPLQCNQKNGYYRVTLPGKALGLNSRSVYLHRIIAYAIFGNKLFEPGITVDHINGNKLDNSPDNLRLIPLAENIIISNQRTPRRKRNKT